MNPSPALGFTPDEIRALSDVQRGTVVVALVAAARADGRLDQREATLLTETLTAGPWAQAGVSREAALGYLKAAEARFATLRDRNGLIALGRECGEAIAAPALREKVAWAMLTVAYADGVFRADEHGFIAAFNAGFGLPGPRFDALCDAAADQNIFAATARGRLDAVRALLDRGFPVNARDGNQWTPLHVAVATGRLAIVSLLLERGADVHAIHGQGSPPLLTACNKPYEAIVERLLRAGARPDDAYAGGTTALHVASLFGQTGVARTLRAGGARLDLADATGRTPLHCAAAEGRTETLIFLLLARAPVDARTSLACTPLHFAATRGDVTSIRALLDAGADVNARDTDGQTPVHYAALNHPEALGVLLACGARPDAATTKGVTPLHFAARGGFTTCARALLDAGAPVDAANFEGGTPLFGAAIHDRRDVYELLVSRGANPHARTAQGATPHGSIGVAKALTLRQTPLAGPVPSNAPAAPAEASASPASALERAIASEPLSAEAAALAARFDDYQVAVWAGDQPGMQQVLIAGTDAHGRPEYVTPQRSGAK
nr:ankyrin repeat domain-containing protein [Polyangiaceae bacterium]